MRTPATVRRKKTGAKAVKATTKTKAKKPPVRTASAKRGKKVLLLSNSSSNNTAITKLIEAAYYLEWVRIILGCFDKKTVITVPGAEPTEAPPAAVLYEYTGEGEGAGESDDGERPPAIIPGSCDTGTQDVPSSFTVGKLLGYVVSAQSRVKKVIEMLGGTLVFPE